MKTARFHVPATLVEGEEIELPEATARHVTRVLRLRPGDALVLFDGRGGERRCTLAIGGARARALVGPRVEREAESALEICLAQGISRGARMDFAIQKATELGVAAVQPLVTERSVVRLDAGRSAARRSHWQTVAAGACEQCGRNRVPAVAAPVPLGDWLGAAQPPFTGIVLSPDAERSLADLRPGAARLVLLIGPEGGLTADEIGRAAGHGYTPVHLGPRVLRTETAAVAALAAVQTLWGDLA